MSERRRISPGNIAKVTTEPITKKMGVKDKLWIDVKDLIPTPGQNVLIYSEEGGVAEGHYDLKDGLWTQYRWSARIKTCSHWMPLPEPPKPDQP